MHYIKSNIKVYRKSATSPQADGQIATDGPLYTGLKFYTSPLIITFAR